MEEIFNRNPFLEEFVNGTKGILIQEYEGIMFYIFRNLDGSCTVGISPENIVQAFDKQEMCIDFANNAKNYFNNRPSC